MYYWYNHKGVRLVLFVLIWINLSLALFEDPAVPGLALPYWVIESLFSVVNIFRFNQKIVLFGRLLLSLHFFNESQNSI